MDARVRTKSPAMGTSRAAFSHRVGGAEPAPIATAKSLPRQQWLPRLTDYHRRCLGKRLGDCHEDLAQAVCALNEAQAWEPGDSSLTAMSGLIRKAYELTSLAQRIGTTATQANAGVDVRAPEAAHSNEHEKGNSRAKLRKKPQSLLGPTEIGEQGRERESPQRGTDAPASSGFLPQQDPTDPRTPANHACTLRYVVRQVEPFNVKE